ncbi:unnamed protein product [Trichobilharzia szidati]|nr:unnamed protein product [Trichobilharzia szidati]
MLCGTCVRLGNITKWVLTQDPIVPLFIDIMTPICYFIPMKAWRTKCHNFTHTELSKIYESIRKVDVTNVCRRMGFCSAKKPTPTVEDSDSCISENINYALSLATTPEYMNMFTESLCENHAANATECVNTVKTAIDFLLQFII